MISLAFKIQERHLLILPAIGVFQQEEEAYMLVTRMRWLLPVLVLVLAVLDLILMMAYMKFFHPWKMILQVSQGDGDIQGSQCFR